MADAALAIARRLLASQGGPTAAADSLRAAADSDEAAAGDARLWAALAYVCSEAGDMAGAAEARRVIARLRAPVEPSPVRSLEPVLEDEGATPRRRGRGNEKDAEQDIADRVALRVADSSARMTALREAARGLFANVTPQSQTPVRRERRTDGVSRLVRHMCVLRARGRNIVTATMEDAQAGESMSDRFAQAALPSEDEEESEPEEDGDDEELEDSSEPDCDSSHGGFYHLGGDSSEDGESEDDEDDDLNGGFSTDDFEVPYVTSDDDSNCAKSVPSFLDVWTSSSSSSSEEDRFDSDHRCEGDAMSRKSLPAKSVSQNACAEFFSEPFLNHEPVCCAVYSLQVSDSEDEIMNTDTDDAPECSVGRRNFWNRPVIRTTPATRSSVVPSNRSRTSRFAETAAPRPMARAVSPRLVFACSPTTPQDASDEDRRDTGNISSGRAVEFTAPRGMPFFYDEPRRVTGSNRRVPFPLDISASPPPATDCPRPERGRGRGPRSQSCTRRVSAVRGGAGAAASAAAPAAGSNRAAPRPHRALTIRPRLQRITAPDPESSDSSDSECCLDEMLRVRRRLRIAASNNGASSSAHVAPASVHRQTHTTRERARSREFEEVHRPGTSQSRRSIFFADGDGEQDQTVAPRNGLEGARLPREERAEALNRMLDEIYEDDEMHRHDRMVGLLGSRNHEREPHQSQCELYCERYCGILGSIEREDRVRLREEDNVAEERPTGRGRESTRAGGQGRSGGGVSEIDLTRAREFLADEGRHGDETGSVVLGVDEGSGDESSDYELDDDFDSDDMVLHRYYLSNALSALHGGADDDDDYAEDLEAEDDDSDSDDEDSNFEPSNYVSGNPPQFRIATRLRESSFLRSLYGSDFDEDSFNDNSITYPTSQDGSGNGTDVADGEISDSNDSATGVDFRLAMQISNVESRFTRAQRRMARNRQELQEIREELNTVSEAMENLGEVMEAGGDVSEGHSGEDWLPAHGHWMGPSHRRFDFQAAFRDDDEDDVIFFGETRTTAEMDKIAPAHVAAAELRCTICVICTEELGTTEVRTLPCAEHRYHKACIDSWCQQNATCPTCRAELKLPTPESPRPSAVTGGERSRVSVPAARRRSLARRSLVHRRGYSST